MSSTSESTWLFVDDRKPRRQESDTDLRQLRSLRLIPVTSTELNQQAELLDYYKNKQELRRINEDEVDLTRRPAITPSRFRRHLKSLPSSVPAKSGHSKEITVSSTGATVGEYVPDTGVHTSAPPPVSFRWPKNAVPQPPPLDMPWIPTRSITEPVRFQPSLPLGVLNVDVIGGASPTMPVPTLPHAHSAPAIPVPLTLPLESLPPGYDFAIQAQFRPDANKLRPLRLLSLDGGGVRGISTLRILKAVMDRVKPGARPCDYFDLIAGTSTGGLIAIMLGRLRMTVDDCIKHYHHLAKKIFKRNPAIQMGSLATMEHRFSPANLEEAIKSVVERASPMNSKMADHHPRCARTFVLAVKRHNVNNQAARRIRSYATKSIPADTCEIWEAGRATSAAPSYFPPIKLADEHGQPRSYVDGGLGYNNPGKEILNEAREVFGSDHSIGCFLSIGTGRDRNIGFEDVRKLNSAYKAFKAIALNSQLAHCELEGYFSGKPGIYYRFNAGARLMGANGDDDFVKAVDLEDWQKMSQVETLTAQYLEEEDTVKQLDRCAGQLAKIARRYK